MTRSVSSRGSRSGAVCPVTTGSACGPGSAARSTFRLGVSGSSASAEITDGTM